MAAATAPGTIAKDPPEIQHYVSYDPREGSKAAATVEDASAQRSVMLPSVALNCRSNRQFPVC
jgi:hypothetical protein